jgi:hypothetical protein
MHFEKKHLIKFCCASMQAHIRDGKIKIVEDETGRDFGYHLEMAGEYIMHCPTCGEASMSASVFAPVGLEVEPDFEKQISRGMSGFELEGLMRLYQFISDKYADGKLSTDAIENIVDLAGGPQARWRFWREGSHNVMDLEQYSCVGECNDTTQHYLIEDKAICTVCLAEQKRDSSSDGIVAVYHIWSHGENKKVVGTVLVQEDEYIGDARMWRVILVVDGHRFQVQEPFNNVDEAKEFASEIEVE